MRRNVAEIKGHSAILQRRSRLRQRQTLAQQPSAPTTLKSLLYRFKNFSKAFAIAGGHRRTVLTQSRSL